MKPELKTYLRNLKQYGQKNDIPNVTEAVGQFLNMMIQIKKPKKILEIGCANGYSTLWMAEAASCVDGKIYTIDHSAPTFAEAQKNVEEAGFSEVIEFHFGDARAVIPQLPDTLKFDLLFIDGQKASYLDFWNLVKTRLNPGAVIIFDDMLAFQHKTKSLTDAIANLDDFDQLLIPIDGDDGILIMRKGI